MEQTDFSFPVNPELSDTDNWVASCCSDVSRFSSPVEGYSPSSAAVQLRSSDDEDYAAYMRLPWEPESSDNSRPCSPREYGLSESSPHPTTLLSCPPSWLEWQPQLGGAIENHQVPLSSSPPEFTSSSPTSDLSSELGNKEGSSSLTLTSSSVQSDSASISVSQHFDCELRPDQFSQRLHELLLLVLHDRELERSSTRDEETDSLSDDSGLLDTCTENFGDDDDSVVAKTRTSTPASCIAINSPIITSKWFSDPGIISQVSKQPSDRDTQQDIEDIDIDISPIRFEIPSSGTLGVFEDATTSTAEVYRIIKRSRSSTRDDESEDTSMPLPKRQKTHKEHSAHARERLFASRTASLRRADSLKSDQLIGDGKTPTLGGCIPTVPATPVPRKARRKATASARSHRSPVPIIAPPADYVPRLPLSAETLAKIRLGKFLEREGRGREKDGFPVCGLEYPRVPRAMDSGDEDQEDSDGEEFGIREESIEWKVVLGIGQHTREEFGVRGELIEWEVAFGIGQYAREEAIDWILDVMPAKENDTLPSSASGSFSSSYSKFSAPSSPSMYLQPSDLMDQLRNSPETRFHAAWMFLRYFYLTMSPDLNMDTGTRNNARNLSRQSSLNSNASASTNLERRDLVIWDIAIACLALSVKFHRDFLNPLLPVYAREYLSLSPQRLSYEDLETAQWDILSVFDYSLGVTPQPVMDELWFSLESLRSLLSFENGWQTAMADAWCSLFDAICEPDVQKFSISTLTAVALMEGIVESLVQRYLYVETLKIKAAAASIFDYSSLTSSIARENRRRRRRGSGEDSLGLRHELELATSNNMKVNRKRKKYLKKAERASEGVRCDIQTLVGITDAQLRNCQDWFSGLD